MKSKYILGRNNELWEELKKLFDLPDGVTYLKLDMGLHTIVTLELTMNARNGSGEQITKRYRLKEYE